MPDKPVASTYEPVVSALLTAEAVGKLLSVSTRSVWRLAASHRLPAPVVVGRRKRWRRAELLDWIEAGLPSRGEWEGLRPGNPV